VRGLTGDKLYDTIIYSRLISGRFISSLQSVGNKGLLIIFRVLAGFCLISQDDPAPARSLLDKIFTLRLWRRRLPTV
jgi:hypothetical protein